MKELLLKILKAVFNRFGLTICRIKDQAEEQTYVTFLENLTLTQPNYQPPNSELYPAPADVNFIVFSKDRALQVHALLTSMALHVSHPVKTFVLYRASDAQHEQAYQEVNLALQNQEVRFIREQNFRQDLLALINQLTVAKVIFLVDDMVFTEPVDLLDFTQFDTRKYVPTLRFGKHLNFCYTHQKPQPLPKFMAPKTFREEAKIIWKWQDGVLDWQYPLSVDGHLFSVQEIKNMLPLLTFKAPNSLEEAMQVCKPLYLKKYGVAYLKAKIVNIPCNKVQNENSNVSENVTVDYLLAQWQKGYQIDVKQLKHFQNTSAHQYIPFTYIKRSENN